MPCIVIWLWEVNSKNMNVLNDQQLKKKKIQNERSITQFLYSDSSSFHLRIQFHILESSKVCIYLLSMLYVKLQLTTLDFKIQGSAPSQSAQNWLHYVLSCCFPSALLRHMQPLQFLSAGPASSKEVYREVQLDPSPLVGQRWCSLVRERMYTPSLSRANHI